MPGLAIKADDEPNPTSVWDEMTESEIERELAALKLSEPGWQVEARRWRLTWEQKFRQANGGGFNE
jgi:hypothetical protein